MEVIRVLGRVAKLSVGRLGNAEFESSLWRWLQEGKFLAIGDVLFGLCENSTETKDRNGKSIYRPRSTRSLDTAGAVGANLRPFSVSGSARLLRWSTQPWERIYRESNHWN